MTCDLCHAAPGVQRRDGRLLCVECVAGWDYQAALTAEERVRDEQAIERYRQETLDEQPRTRRRRQEWRARARLTGDPERDKATRDAMLDRIAESLQRGRASTADMNRRLRGGVEVTVGEPACSACLDGDLEHERTMLCAATHTAYKNCGVDCCVAIEEEPDGP